MHHPQHKRSVTDSHPRTTDGVVSRDHGRIAGGAAVVVAMGGVLAATAVSPTFVWADSALSDMGVTGASAWLFNGALILGGLLALPYAWMLWTAAADRLSYLRAGTFLVAVVAMAGVGLFPSGHPLHLPMALGFYLLAMLTLLADGVARIRLGRGKLALLFGLAVPMVWPLWLLWLPFGPGIAVPEFVGALLFSTWVVVLSPERPRLRP